MPQASDENRELMNKWFNSIEDYHPVKFLKSHGFILTNKWQWIPPVPYHSISCYELSCILFLIDEWDFGGLINDYGITVCLCKGMQN